MPARPPPLPSTTSAPPLPAPYHCPTCPHMPETGCQVRAPLCPTPPPCPPGRPASTSTWGWAEVWAQTGTSNPPPPPSLCPQSRRAPRRDVSRWPLFLDAEGENLSQDDPGPESRGLRVSEQWMASPASRAFTPRCVTIKTLPFSPLLRLPPPLPQGPRPSAPLPLKQQVGQGWSYWSAPCASYVIHETVSPRS